MMAEQRHTESSFSYVDDVKVKVAEKSKPPPKINIGITYAQRLSMNKQLQDNLPTYQFKMESCIKEKMKEWKKARNTIAKEQQLALEHEKLKEKLSKENEVVVIEEFPSTDSNRETEKNSLGAMLVPTQAKIFTEVISDCSPINISDFEPDTSSPFDNLELKSINDIEELKIVLQNEDSKNSKLRKYVNEQVIPTTSNAHQYSSSYDTFSTSQNSGLSYSASFMPQSSMNQMYPSSGMYTRGSNGYIYYPNDETRYTYNGTSHANDSNNVNEAKKTPAETLAALESISSIVQSLNEELEMRNTIANDNKRNDIQETTEDNLENPYHTFSKQQQTICRTIAAMGFPLPRVARVYKTIGGDDDEKKVVDCLLFTSQLMDLGFPEEKVTNALLKTSNDRDKALELLIS